MNPITREESLLDGQDLTPITRKEQFIKRIYDKTQEIPEPITREEYFLKKAGEGTSPVTIEQLNVTENGTYSEQGKAYSPVIVEVPAPTLKTKTITENGTYNASEDNADGYSQVTVNVPLPQNAKLITSAENYPITDAADYPLPKCDVTVTDADKCEVIVTTDNTITEDSGVYLERQSGGGNRELDEIVGGSVVWNQLVKETDTSCTVQSGHKYVLKQGSTYTVVVSDGTAFTVDGSVDDNVHDLTALFGSTIADYIYSLEQSTAGSGIAWLKSYGYLTEDYYGYTANKIESVSVARHIMKDSNDSVIGSYAINPITLRGIPKLNASNQLYYDGDRYEASGRVTRKCGVVDLGTLTWSYRNDTATYFYTNINFIKYSGNWNDNPYPILSNKYIALSRNTMLLNNVGIAVDGALAQQMPSQIQIYDSAYTDAAAFKTAMNGVYLVYEKATPTTESTSPFETNQIVDANGTEEYIDAGVDAGTRDVAIPVGHKSKYFNGEGYITYLEPNTSDTIDMAQEHAIMPLETTYISANGTLDVEYWK